MRGFLLVVAAVLGAIGVGVGVEASVPPPAYGPPAARFRAAFASPPSETSEVLEGIGTMRRYQSGGPLEHLTVTVWSYEGTGWTGFAGPPAVRARCGPHRCVAVYAGLGRRHGGRIVTWSARATGPSAAAARSLASSLAPLPPAPGASGNARAR